MKKILIIIAVLLFTTTGHTADPAPNSVTGTLTPGSQVVFGGANFGTAPIILEWLGTGCSGSGCPLSTSSGQPFSRSGWGVSDGVTVSSASYFTVSQSNSIAGNFSADIYTQAIIFDTGSVHASYFVSYNAQIKITGTRQGTFQWKEFQLQKDTRSETENDQIFVGDFWDNTDAFVQGLTEVSDDTTPGTWAYLNWHAETAAPIINIWHTREMYWTYGASSTGSLVHKLMRNPGTSAIASVDTVSGTLPNASTNLKRYASWENYIGGISDKSNYKTYLSDIYIATGPQRVLLCDTSTWTARTKCAVQGAVGSWSATSITISALNIGPFASDAQVYVYVVASDQSVNSSGYGPITLGSGEVTFTATLELTNATTTGNPATVASGGNKSFTVTPSFDYKVTCTGCDTWTPSGDGGTCAFTNVTANKSGTCVGSAKKHIILR